MKDSILVQGQRYIATRIASDQTGYSADYIGQIARGGKVRSTMVGKTRFVSEEDLVLYTVERLSKTGKITSTVKGKVSAASIIVSEGIKEGLKVKNSAYAKASADRQKLIPLESTITTGDLPQAKVNPVRVNDHHR